jgi:hypothetical protein
MNESEEFKTQFGSRFPCAKCIGQGLKTCCCVLGPTPSIGRPLREDEPDVAEAIQKRTKYQRLREGFSMLEGRTF